MAIEFWTPHAGMSQIVFTGHVEFRDVKTPAPSKDEWGLDVLERTVRGPGKYFEAYGAALKQGDVYGQHFYLQSWRPIEHAIFPGWQLTYKGVRAGALPTALPVTSFSELVSTVEANDLEVTYQGKTIISASKEVKYIAPTTTYRYISRGRPTTPRYGAVDTNQPIQNIDSRTVVTLLDDSVTPPVTSTMTLTGAAPAAVATALAGSPVVFVIGPTFEPILGTPYYECQEVVQMKYPG